MKTIRLKRGKEESLKRFHPWIFSGAIAEPMPAALAEGETVQVVDHAGAPLGLGHYQIGSIAVRMLTFGPDTPEAIDEAFFAERLANALRLRKALNLNRPDNNCFRLVHGEGDFLPGLVVDVYGSTAVLQAHSPAMHLNRMEIARAIVSLPSLEVKNVYYKSDTTLPYKAGLNPVNGYLIGGFDTDEATENGLIFRIDWLRGQKTGFFLDQRDNRNLVRRMSAGRRVLNMFCYTGGFSVYALAGGAREVHSVDSSEKAITLTDANLKRNFGASAYCRSYVDDAFKFLSAMEPAAYDLIILDPPAFAKHRTALKNALRGYQRLNAKAMEKIAPGGILFTFSCSQAVSREQFRLAVFSAAAQTGRRISILHQLSQPADHPVNIYHPEGEYLKGLVLYVE